MTMQDRAPANRIIQGRWLAAMLLLCFVLVLLSSCRSTGSSGQMTSATSEIRYTKYNIHAQQSRRDIKASYAGYVDSGDGHFVIPAGSKVMFPGKGQRWRNGFWFTVADTGQKVFFEFHRGRMGMGEHEYIELITSGSPVSLDRFSEQDRKGIKTGKVYTGMTKEGVLTALGYPAKHRTPSLESNTWIYWRNRFMTMGVVFDGNGRVVSITD
ncbi:hypothetical protein SAMN06295888_10436 [Desulfonatronum zhilinae]|nr:hypothetical protein SAMN06295888_10436 [Desulfonatronum zhilinae]